MAKPVPGTYPSYFEAYISEIAENDLQEAFKKQANVVNTFFDAIDETKADHAYAPGKWTIKELLQHVIDAERIFNFRSLCFARKEQASLPGFDENDYAAHSNAGRRTWKSLVEELKAVRKTTEQLFNSFDAEMLQTSGMANNNPTTVNAMGFVIIGHLYHHKNIIESRYLQQAT
jgi:uncharacterized damage-inducible protein DinB